MFSSGVGQGIRYIVKCIKVSPMAMQNQTLVLNVQDAGKTSKGTQNEHACGKEKVLKQAKNSPGELPHISLGLNRVENNKSFGLTFQIEQPNRNLCLPC